MTNAVSKDGAVSLEWQALKDKGNTAFKDHRYDDAIGLYSDAIKLKPDEAVLFSNRSACFLETGDNTAAEQDALKSIEMDKSFLRAYSRLHSALCNMGRFKEAAEKANTGVKVAPVSASVADVRQLRDKATFANEADAALNKYKDLFEKGDLESAADQLRNPIKHFPQCHHIVFPFVEASANVNQDEAERLLREVKHSSSIESDLHFLFALVKYYRGQEGFPKAQTILRETLGADPEHSKCKQLLRKIRQVESHKEAGNTAFKQNATEEAIKEYSAAIDLDPLNLKMVATLRGNRGAAKMAQKDFQGALLDCNFAINNGVTTGKMYARRSRIKQELEQMEDALRDMQRAAEIDQSFTAELKQLQVRCRSAKKKNYYKALDISRSETDPKVIKKAYMKACLKWHPDKWSKSSAEEKEVAEVQFKEVTEAYEVLSDPQKKYRYDNGLDDNTVGAGAGSPFGFPSGGGGGGYGFGRRPGFGGGMYQQSPFSFFGMDDDDGFNPFYAARMQQQQQQQQQRMGASGRRYVDPRQAGGFSFF